MEALKSEENPDTASRRMRELQGRWKEVALAPRMQGEAMWRRFKTAQDEIFNRTAAHFAAQNAERSTNLVKKQALVERAEALAPSSDWVKTAAQMQALQAEWKTIGPVSRGQEKRSGSGSAPPAIASLRADRKISSGARTNGRRTWRARKRCAHRRRRLPNHPTGTRPPPRSRSCRRSGRRSARCGRRSRRSSGSASAKRAIASSSATSTAIRWSSRRRQKRATR